MEPPPKGLGPPPPPKTCLPRESPSIQVIPCPFPHRYPEESHPGIQRCLFGDCQPGGQDPTAGEGGGKEGWGGVFWGVCVFFWGGRPPARLTLRFSQVFGLQLVEIDTKHHIYILTSNLPRAEGENLHWWGTPG